jgi:septum formation protein
MTKIILATGSPYRIEAFKFLGIDFTAEVSKVDESQLARDNPEELVSQLAKLKAEAVAQKYYNTDTIVIGMDSVGFFQGKILEKPRSQEEGFLRLEMLSGNNYHFYTGIFMLNTADNQTLLEIAKTEVWVRKLSEIEINKYLDQDPNFNTYALGYDPLGHFSSTFNVKIEGSYNNALRGIPLEVVIKMLYKLGYKINYTF